MFDGLHWLRFRQVFRRTSLCLAMVSLAAVVSPRSSYAVDATVDLAVEAFAAGGAAVGIPITPSEKSLVKPLVQCVADGKPVIDCTKEAIIQQLPPEAQGFAKCVSGGKKVETCSQEAIIGNLPPQTRELTACVVTGTDVTECGKRFATTQAEKAAFATIEKLKA